MADAPPWDNMTADEQMVASVAPGYWYSLALIGYFKRVLLGQRMSVADRLHTLEGLGAAPPAH